MKKENNFDLNSEKGLDLNQLELEEREGYGEVEELVGVERVERELSEEEINLNALENILI